MHIATIFIAFALLTGCMGAEAQKENNNDNSKIKSMDTSKLSNPTVKEAFQAWQAGDSTLWLSYFTPDAQLLDDGHPRDFQNFSREAIGHERFTSIDIVKDTGRSIYGKFHSDTWGNFKTYFKFHLDAHNKIYKLEIGQADY
ncbi:MULTISPECIES: nuclear transport factor 2-like protein [Niastella]|uniref:Nuclear transport factor 2 family protein n=1 Tax=Niastella soli TaxID=2821487 RepID=A0ABS3Z1Q7_9BACT|nr:nuclear transport factor 2 family protein [Niastella soli]MBO9203336.1 nuclear transport factor 2 family protein [Niastella soli]